MNVYVGDVNKLFDYGTPKEEVDAYFKEDIGGLVIFGSTFNKHDPLGTNIKKNLKKGDYVVYDKWSAFYKPPVNPGTMVITKLENVIAIVDKDYLTLKFEGLESMRVKKRNGRHGPHSISDYGDLRN